MHYYPPPVCLFAVLARTLWEKLCTCICAWDFTLSPLHDVKDTQHISGIARACLYRLSASQSAVSMFLNKLCTLLIWVCPEPSVGTGAPCSVCTSTVMRGFRRGERCGNSINTRPGRMCESSWGLTPATPVRAQFNFWLNNAARPRCSVRGLSMGPGHQIGCDGICIQTIACLLYVIRHAGRGWEWQRREDCKCPKGHSVLTL